MDSTTIRPERITTPIQLLAVWMAGLVLLVSAFLTAAHTVRMPEWLPVMFGIAAVVIVPLFLVFVFILQTKYRPQMQEDRYYSKYLDRDTLTYVEPSSPELKELEDLSSNMRTWITNLQNRISEGQKMVEQEMKTPKDFSSRAKKYFQQLSPELDLAKQRLQWSSFNFRVNSRLSNLASMIQFLGESGITRIESFVSSDRLLPIALLSIPKTLSLDAAKHLIKGLTPLGIDSICLNGKETVYLGSLAYRSGKQPILKLDDPTTQELLAATHLEEMHSRILTANFDVAAP